MSSCSDSVPAGTTASVSSTKAVVGLLKNLGHGVGNITRAFDTLRASKPALTVQTRKEGSSKQARKKFRVTTEGHRRITLLSEQSVDQSR